MNFTEMLHSLRSGLIAGLVLFFSHDFLHKKKSIKSNFLLIFNSSKSIVQSSVDPLVFTFYPLHLKAIKTNLLMIAPHQSNTTSKNNKQSLTKVHSDDIETANKR